VGDKSGGEKPQGRELVVATIEAGLLTVTRFWPKETTLAELLVWFVQEHCGDGIYISGRD
jgi:hypothetical protein